MKEIADAIANYIREKFPQLEIEMVAYQTRVPSLRVRTLFFPYGPNVRIEVSPDHLVLFKRSKLNQLNRTGPKWEIEALSLPWELPDLFDTMDAALSEL